MRKTEDCCKSHAVDFIEVTRDTLTSRGGLVVFVRYLTQIELFAHLSRLFGGIRKSRKGLSVVELFKQLFCFFLDGTSRHLVRFDHLAKDEGYAATIETPLKRMASSHQIKRFFQGFSFVRVYVFRRLLQRLFLWRLGIEQPDVLILNVDAMVMDNDEASQREGVKPTYQKVKGFAPLQMTWGRYVIDAVFRGGNKHSNHGDTVEKMVGHVVRLVRKKHGAVPIIVRMDGGFFDQKLFTAFERMEIGYIIGGNLYGDIRDYIKHADSASWRKLSKGRIAWHYVEFGDRRKAWKRYRRALFCRALSKEDGQQYFEFARPDTLIYTNIGQGQAIDHLLEEAGKADLLSADMILKTYHGRGSDELVHRALKDFGPQALPFKAFEANAAFYYTMLVAFFLFEAFKEDVTAPVIPVTAYATRLRREIIDIAAKIVSKSRYIILKVTQATRDNTQIDQLWKRANNPPRLQWQ